MYYVVMTNKKSIVATRIEDLLRLKDMSIADLSRATGVSESSISNILSGKRKNPRSDTVEKIARGFPTSPDYLNGHTDNPEPNDAPPLPEFAAEVLDLMRKLDRGRNYELYVVAKGFLESGEEIRRLARRFANGYSQNAPQAKEDTGSVQCHRDQGFAESGRQ